MTFITEMKYVAVLD